ncbi:MAG: sugar ABC transporter permease [Eubacteriales bacterium]|nr:sugar ABC transporter permease [Eubacteriales bacterium]
MMKTRRKIVRYDKGDTRVAWLMLSPFLLFFALFVLYPILMNIYYSFTNYNLDSADWVGLKNYRRLFRDKAFLMALKNTSIYAFFGVVALTVLGFATASVLNRKIRGIRFIRMLMIFPYATSMTAVAMIWLMLLDPTAGLINKILRMAGLTGVDWLFNVRTALPCLIFVHIWKNIGYCMLIYLAGMQSIPEELYEAATVDGASEFNKLFHITLPMVRPVSFFVLITTMLESFKTFDQVKLMTGGDPLYSTTTIVHQIYQRGFAEFRMGYAAAMSVVLLVIMLAITLMNYALGKRGEKEA